jgi:autoinducer 2-degrading protein
MLAIVVELRVLAEMRADFLQVMSENARDSVSKEPGCLRFDVVEDRSSSNHFLLYELYLDDAAFAAHREAPHFLRWRELSSRCLEPVRGQVTRACVPWVLSDDTNS